MVSWVIVAVFCGVYVSCDADPCKLSEDKCLEKFSAAVLSKLSWSKIVEGDPTAGIEVLDPIHQNVIEGNLSLLKYNITDSDTFGLKDCTFTPDSFKWKEDNLLTHHFEILCRKLEMKGKYDLNGRLIVLPVEGSGDFFMTTNKYLISMDAELKIAAGKDGKHHLHVTSFKQTADPLESITFNFENLFNGQKDLADAVLKFANENWHEVALEVQDPIFTAHLKKLVKNFNKHLKKIPIDDLAIL